MKELEVTFEGKGEVKGDIFKQIIKSEVGYMYSVAYEDKISHYEVFRRKENTQYDNISYPKSTSFGKWAWTYYVYKNAITKFNELK